jgi:long-subunit fatty acid transport protein
VLFFFLFPQSLFAQPFANIKINSSPNPIGSGARAVGMGSAFIAVADDATAASWNPGGLIQLETPEFSIVGSGQVRRDDFRSSAHSEASGMNEKTRYDLNYFSIAYPFRLFERNMIVSLSYQRLFDFYKELDFDFRFSSRVPGFARDAVTLKTQFRQSGGLKAIAPAYAIQITPSFSLGATFNIWTDELFWDNEWTAKTRVKWAGTASGGLTFQGELNERETFSSFEGFNMNFGFLWNVTPVVTVGAVVRTPFTADVDYEFEETRWSLLRAVGARSRSQTRFSEHRRIKMPMSYGLGIALRLSDAFTISMDVSQTKWSRFFLEDGSGRETSPIDGSPRSQSHVHDTTQVRLGCEYLVILEKTIIPIRCGLFYDPEPAEKHSEDFFGFSLGSGIMLGKHYVFDCAYQFRYGDNVSGDVLGIPTTDADVVQHNFLASLIYHF